MPLKRALRIIREVIAGLTAFVSQVIQPGSPEAAYQGDWLFACVLLCRHISFVRIFFWSLHTSPMMTTWDWLLSGFLFSNVYGCHRWVTYNFIEHSDFSNRPISTNGYFF